jgi:2-hydroxymethylglutarate dehydrogenase
MKIGFIGLGVMGKNMATNLIKKGYNLKVSDLNKDAVNELKEMGAEEGQSAAEVASGSDIVFTSLPNSQIVEGVVTGKGGILEGAKEGTIYIDLSSITPKTIQNIAKKS